MMLSSSALGRLRSLAGADIELPHGLAVELARIAVDESLVAWDRDLRALWKEFRECALARPELRDVEAIDLVLRWEWPWYAKRSAVEAVAARVTTHALLRRWMKRTAPQSWVMRSRLVDAIAEAMIQELVDQADGPHAWRDLSWAATGSRPGLAAQALARLAEVLESTPPGALRRHRARELGRLLSLQGVVGDAAMVAAAVRSTTDVDVLRATCPEPPNDPAVLDYLIAYARLDELPSRGALLRELRRRRTKHAGRTAQPRTLSEPALPERHRVAAPLKAAVAALPSETDWGAFVTLLCQLPDVDLASAVTTAADALR